MFSVNLSELWQEIIQINDATLLFFSAKIATYWAINVWVFKTELEYFCAQMLHSSMLVHTQLTVLQRAATQQLSAKVLKSSFEYLHLKPKKWRFLQKKIQNCKMSCQMSDLRKTLKYNQSRDLEGLYPMNTLNIYRVTDAAPGLNCHSQRDM